MKKALILLYFMSTFAAELFADDRAIRTGSTLGTQVPAEDPPPSPQPATESLATRREPRAITNGTTSGYIPKFDNSGALTESAMLDTGSQIVIDSRVLVRHPAPRLHLQYDASPGAGGDVTGSMSGIGETLSFGFNSEGLFSGAQATATGRTLYFFDRVAS